jgi:lipopolysaccharide transport system ATP-binding protein
VGSLLEIGTGFHSELTGRENILLSGTILGMSTGEIARKFHEIVAFSGVERFIDTPIKRYSSGMKVRLAFSVAAHLEPEILLIDEVLAVGDAEFQRRCLGKMHEVRQNRARAVIFVSHDMAAVEALCDFCILLDRGAVAAAGPAGEIVDRYLRQFAAETAVPLDERTDREGLGGIRMTGVRLLTPAGVATGRPLSLAIRYAAGDGGEPPTEFGCSIWSSRDVKLVSISSLLTGTLREIPGSGEAVCSIPALPLVQGHYKVNVFVSSRRGIEDYVLNAAPIEVKSADVFGTGRTVDPRWGAIVVDHAWSVRAESAAP